MSSHSGSPPSTSIQSHVAVSSSSHTTSHSTASTRLSQVANHTSTQSPTMASTSLFDAATVPLAPEDPLFGLMAAYRADESSKKVDLGIGAYRDNNAKPFILPVVKQVGLRLDSKMRTRYIRHQLITAGRRHLQAKVAEGRDQQRISSYCWSGRVHSRSSETHPRS
jgi:aspartate aminotransferase, cytoplasmic